MVSRLDFIKISQDSRKNITYASLTLGKLLGFSFNFSMYLWVRLKRLGFYYCFKCTFWFNFWLLKYYVRVLFVNDLQDLVLVLFCILSQLQIGLSWLLVASDWLQFVSDWLLIVRTDCECFVTLLFYYFINPIYSNSPFLYPLKTSGNQRFSDFFRGCRNGILGENGLFV